jgi:hypothetical protein
VVDEHQRRLDEENSEPENATASMLKDQGIIIKNCLKYYEESGKLVNVTKREM